jgi:S-adenosylmethionine uptake transporter
MHSNLRGALLSLAAFGAYATHDVVVKLLGETYTSFQIMFFSGLMGFPLVMMMLMGDRRESTLIPRHPWWSALRSVAAVSTGVMGFFAFSQLPMATCYAIFFAMPLLITLMAIPMLGEKVGIRRGIAVLVGLVGVIIVLRPGAGDSFSIGHLAALGAAVTGALTSVIVRKIGQEERSVVLMLYPMVLTFFAMGAMHALRLRADDRHPSWPDRRHGLPWHAGGLGHHCSLPNSAGHYRGTDAVFPNSLGRTVRLAVL